MRSRSLLLFVPLLGGCLWNNKGATDAYARQVAVGSMRIAQLEEELVDAQSRVEQVEEALREQGEEQVTKLETIEQVNVELGDLRGELEVLRHDLETLRDDLTDLYVDHERRSLHSERRLAEIEKYLKIKPPPPPTDEELGLEELVAEAEDGEEDPDGPLGAEGEDSEDPAEDELVPETAAEKLALAQEHMRDKKYAVARAILRKAVDEHEGAAEMDEIRYRLAETHFRESAWVDAARAFQVLVDDFPASPWTPWALLRQGECFAGLGKHDSAKVFYETVVSSYPKTDAAKQARRLLGG